MKTITTSSTARLSAWTEPRQALDGKSPMDQLYCRMEGMYMSRWRKEFPTPESIENWTIAWAEAFAEEGITPEEIRRGIAACRKLYDWAPSLTEFIKACRPALDYEAAFHEAREQMLRRRHPVERDGVRVTLDVWSHPAIFWAAAKLGTDFEQLPYPQIKSRWRRALDSELASPTRPVPEFREALPAPSRSTVPPEVAKQRIGDMLKALGRDRMPRQPEKVTDRNLEQKKRQTEQALAELLAHKEKTKSEG